MNAIRLCLPVCRGMARVLVLAGALILGPVVSGTAPPEPLEGPVVVLPTLVVHAQDTRFDNWSKTASPHFVLYTDYGAAEAHDILLKLERVRAALDRLSGLPSGATRPISFIYPSKHSDWDKLEKFDRKVNWSGRVVTWGADGNITVLEVVRQGMLLAQLIVREDPHFGFNGVLGDDFCRAHNLPNPMWFNIGVSLLTAYADVRADKVRFGRPNMRESSFYRGNAMSCEQFFSFSSRSPEYSQTRSILSFYAQSSLSVRYLLANPDPERRIELYSWLYYLKNGNPATEASFRQVFGLDWAAWMSNLQAIHYRFGHAAAPGIEIGITPAEGNPPILRVDLRPVEMRELFLLAQIAGGAAQHSGDVLDHLLAQGIKTNELRPLLASACIREKRTEAALAILRTLCSEGGTNPRIYEEAARLLFAQAVPKFNLDSQMGSEAEEIRPLCQKAIALNPHSIPANDLLAWSLVLDPKIDRGGIATLHELVTRQASVHHTREIQAALALAAYRRGDTALANQICHDLSVLPRQDDRAATILRQLAAALPPAGDSR